MKWCMAAGPCSPPAGSASEQQDPDNLIYTYKVAPCPKRYPHDWHLCPFAHPREKARRRDPRRYSYTGIACPSMRQNSRCDLGDNCPFAHNVFEYWLHPTRYRTQLCNDGAACTRKLCFFAHSMAELRMPDNKPFVAPDALLNAAALSAARLTADGPSSPAASSSPRDSMLAASVQQRGSSRSPARHHNPQQQQQQQQVFPQLQQQSQQQNQLAVTQEQEQDRLIAHVTRMLERGELSADSAAAILRQVLSLETLHSPQTVAAHCPQLGSSQQLPEEMAGCFSDTMGYASRTAEQLPLDPLHHAALESQYNNQLNTDAFGSGWLGLSAGAGAGVPLPAVQQNTSPFLHQLAALQGMLCTPVQPLAGTAAGSLLAVRQSCPTVLSSSHRSSMDSEYTSTDVVTGPSRASIDSLMYYAGCHSAP